MHTIAEAHRHAGHADLVRELIDGTAGLTTPGDAMASEDAAWWAARRDRREQVAREAGSP